MRFFFPVLVAFSFLSLISVSAQSMAPVASLDAFKKTFLTETQKVTSFECDFVQSKHIVILSETVQSKGKCYFRRPDQISMQYNAPTGYGIVIVGSKMKMGTTVMEMKENTLAGEMQSMISACMGGRLDVLMDKYDVKTFENSLQYKVLISPRANAAKTGISGMEMFLDKKDFSMAKMVIRETSEDFTEYVFSNKKLNIPLSDALFSLR